MDKIGVFLCSGCGIGDVLDLDGEPQVFQPAGQGIDDSAIAQIKLRPGAADRRDGDQLLQKLDEQGELEQGLHHALNASSSLLERFHQLGVISEKLKRQLNQENQQTFSGKAPQLGSEQN